jgi:hypothetical protein
VTLTQETHKTYRERRNGRKSPKKKCDGDFDERPGKKKEAAFPTKS